MQRLVWIGPLVFGAGSLFFFSTLVRVRMLVADDKRWAASTGQPYFSHFGDAWVGRTHAKAAFAHLTMTPTALRLVVQWRRYEFPRISITRLGPWSPVWGGVAIQHSISAYPVGVAFVPKDMRLLVEELETLGYHYDDRLSRGSESNP